MDSNGAVLTLLAVISVAVCVLILAANLIRRMVLWYWRVNEVVAPLEKIEANTRPAGAVQGKPRTIDQMPADRSADLQNARVAAELRGMLP